MTYEELQAENRRLRARIHELEQNPQNIVLGPDAFLPILTGDIEAAQSLVVLSCESLQYMKGTCCFFTKMRSTHF